jgi:hypothetical protein
VLLAHYQVYLAAALADIGCDEAQPLAFKPLTRPVFPVRACNLSV